jgi:hypothetical protein
MTHVLNDEEFQEYLNLKKTVEEQEGWINAVKKNAMRYMEDNQNNVICWHEVSIHGVCDWCPVGHIFPECPLGKRMTYSK